MRGATVYGDKTIDINGNFNPRAHEGRDEKVMIVGVTRWKFQSTRP